MKMQAKYFRSVLFIYSILFFSACGSPPQTENGHVIALPVDSLGSGEQSVAYVDSVSIVKQVNVSNINQYIHPEKGLWLIQSSGAMPNMTNTTQVDRNFPVDFSASQNRELPKVDCGSKTLWTKEGCYVQEMNLFRSEKIWMHCGLSKKEELVIEELAKSIRLSAINTYFGARYYFSMIDGKWYLTFVDLRKPCEA